MKVDYKGYYVYSDGRVFSRNMDRFVSPSKNKKGYCVINFNYKTEFVHRVVAKLFVTNPDNKPFVNHKNGIKTDNRVENLEWVTSKENTDHAIKSGLMNQVGENNSSGKLKLWQVKTIRFVRKYYKKRYTHQKLSVLFRISTAQISNIENNRSWL